MLTDFKSVNILSKEEIFSLPTPCDPEHECGLYFLLRGDDLVYVGMSRVGISDRVLAHKTRGIPKRFDRFSTVDVQTWNIELVEAIYIHRYRPEYNADFPNVAALASRMKPFDLIMDEDEAKERDRFVDDVNRLSSHQKGEFQKRLRAHQKDLEAKALALVAG